LQLLRAPLVVIRLLAVAIGVVGAIVVVPIVEIVRSVVRALTGRRDYDQ
jgi:hypothetical protein